MKKIPKTTMLSILALLLVCLVLSSHTVTSSSFYFIRYKESKDDNYDADPPVYRGTFAKVSVPNSRSRSIYSKCQNYMTRFFIPSLAYLSRVPLLSHIPRLVLITAALTVTVQLIRIYVINGFILEIILGPHVIKLLSPQLPPSSPEILWYNINRANQTIITLTRSGRYMDDPEKPYTNGLIYPHLRYIFPKQLSYLYDTPANRRDSTLYNSQYFDSLLRECLYVLKSKSCILSRFNAMPYTRVPKEDEQMLHRWARQLGINDLYQFNSMGLCMLCTKPGINIEYLDTSGLMYLKTGKMLVKRPKSEMEELKKKCLKLILSKQCIKGGTRFLRNDEVKKTDMQELDEWAKEKGFSSSQDAVDAEGLCFACRMD